MLRIIPNKNNIGAEIDTDLQKLSKENFKIIINALNKYGMVFFRRQNLSSKHYVEFAKNFGKLADYPRLKGLNKKYPQITVVQRKESDKGPSFGEQFHTDSIYTKKPPRFTMLLSKIVPNKGKANTEFCSQYHAFKDLTKSMKRKLLSLKGVYSSEGPISITTKERVKEKGKKIKELKSNHKIIRKISSNYAIYSSPGHLVGFQPKIKNTINLKKKLFKHQIKKKISTLIRMGKKSISYLG